VLPLLLGMVVIVPPQPYLEVVEKLGYSGSYLDFLGRYFSADQRFCRGKDCLVLPFPVTHNLVWDWFNHALSALMLVLGLGLFGHADDCHGAWAAALRWRWWALGLSVPLLWGMPWALDVLGGWHALPAWGQQIWLAMGGARHWLPLVAVLGFARRHLRQRDGRWRRILTEAVLPAYVVHQTIIVLAAHHLARLGWPQGLEAAAIIVLTVSGCTATHLAAQHWRWTRPWLGLPVKRGSGA
jgi:glucans biosynthesis protein C